MANELDDAFDALPEAPAAASVSSLDAEFDALPAAELAPTEELAPSVTGFTAEDIDPAQADQKAARHQRLRLAFDAAQQTGDKAARAYAVKNALGVKYSEALDNLEGFESAAKLAQFDPERYERDNPVLAKLLERRPELAELVLTDKEAAWSVKAWDAIQHWNARPVKTESAAEQRKASEELSRAADERNQTTTAAPLTVGDPLEAERNRPFEPPPAPEAPAQAPEALAVAQAAFDAERKAAVAPTKTLELNDAKAKLGKEYGGAFVAFLRAKEAAAREKVTGAQLDWMNAEVKFGEDSPEALDAKGRLEDIEGDAMPRAYGDDSGLSRQLAVGIEGGMSTVEMLEGSVKGAGTAAAVGGGITAAGAFVLTRSPAAAARAFVAGAEVLAPAGAKLGAGWASFNMELGPTYKNNRELVTDDGNKLTAREAYAAAVIESGMKAGLESLSFGAQTKALAGGLAAMRERLRGQLISNPTFRKKLVQFGAEWLKGAAAEGGTGGLQSLVEQIGDYLVQSGKDTEWQKGDVVDVKRTLTDAEAEFTGGVLFGGAAGMVGMGMTQTAASREEHLNKQVPALLTMAQSESFKTAPDAFAETVEQTTSEHGPAVTSIHVDGEAVQRFFQENESDPDAVNQKLVELIGPEGPARLTEALATGGKVEISMERVPTWAGSDIGKALVSATSLDPESLSPEQLALRSPEIKAEAKRLAAAAESEVKEDAELEAALPDVEKQLVATGRATRQEAKATAQIWKAFSTTMARDFGVPAAALFKHLQVRFGIGEEGQASLEGVLPARIEQPAGPDDLVQFEAGLTDDQRRELMFLDVDPGAAPGTSTAISGLHSRRAWDARIPTPGTVTGLISIPDVKAINDNEKGSHDVTNRLLRLFGAKLGAVTEGRQSARSGTDFLVEVVDQAQLDSIVEQLRSVAPEGIKVLGFTGKDVKEAGAAEKRATADLRKLEDGNPAKLLPRGQTAFKLDTLTDDAFPSEPARRTVPKHLTAIAPPTGGAFVKDFLMSTRVPGARSRAGFYAAGPRKFSASLDMRGLKNINLMMKSLLMATGLTEEQADAQANATGDEVMARFGEAAQRAGGGEVFFSHMSGDEFAAKADSQELLDLFIADLQAELQKVDVPVMIDGVEHGLLTPKFRSGVAEGSYGKADQQLNRDKAREPKLAEVSPADDLRRAGILHDRAPGAQGPGDAGSGSGPPGHPGGPGAPGGIGAAAGGTEGRGSEGGRGAADRGDQAQPAAGPDALEGGAGRGDEAAADGRAPGVDAETEAVIAEREARGPLRDEEVEALNQGFNLPEAIELARAAIARMKGSTVKPIASETKKALKARKEATQKALLERRAATEAYLGWVENTGPGIQEKGLAFGREGALQVSKELLREIELWARNKFNLVDPQSGLTAYATDAARGTNDYKGPKTKKQAQPLELAKHNPGANDTLINMLKQENEPGPVLFQRGDKAPRGYMMLPAPGRLEKVYSVFLNKRADASTAIHESGHVFLEMVFELAQRSDAPGRLKEQTAAILKWLGLNERSELTLIQPSRGQKLTPEQEAHNKRATTAHEKFARGFEAYLYEGKAPTDALNKAFTSFKLWLVKIYRSITSLNVELSPEVRQVFDRLLATDDELQAERQEHGPALFATAEEAGMTPEEFVEYQEDLRQAEEHAKRKAELHVLRERLVVTEAWWQNELKAVTAKAGEDYERLQARKAQRILGGVDIGELQGEPVVFDRQAVEQLVGKGAAKKLNTTEENGTHPDEVAEFTGYPTGGAMLAAVLSLPTKETWVKREAEARMKEAHPSVLDDRAKLRKMVAEGLHAVTEKRLLEERAALRSRGPRGSTAPAPIEAIKQAGKLIVEKTPLGRLQPHLHLGAERKAANDAVRFAVTGNTEAALEANTRQLLNAAAYREAMQAAEEREGLFELAKQMSTQKARARWGKASPTYRDAIDFLLEAAQLKDGQLDAAGWAKGWAATTEAVKLMEADDVAVGGWEAPLGEMLIKNDWRKLTVREMRTLRDALENIRAAAVQKNTALVDGKRMDRDTVIAELIREIREFVRKQRTPGTASSDVLPDKALKGWNAFDAFLSNPQDTFRQLSNDNPDSMIWKALAAPMQRAKHREADLLKKVIKPILDAFDAMPEAMRARADEKLDGAKLFPGHTDKFLAPRRRHELWMLALNYGNDGNAQRVRDGRNISDAEVRAALDLLTKEELEVIQTILDAHEKLRPEAFDLEERDTGLRPEAVKARPLQLKNGVLRGGYFPVAYERASQAGKKQESQATAGIMDPTYGRGATPRGHLKARASEVHDNIVTLDPRRLFANYAQVAHDIAFREAVKSVNALLTTDKVEQALQERAGLERTAEAQQWVKDVAQMRAAEMSDGWSRAQRWIRGNMAPALLGYYLPNAIGDLANLVAAVASTPLQAKHLAAGMAEFGGQLGEARKVALEKSGELRFMQDQLARDFQKHVKDLSRGKVARGFAKVKDHAFVFMEGVNVATATPVWIGAYRQALAEGKSEQQAVDFGDDILRRVFPSHSAVDQSAILRDKKFWGTMTVFYGYLSVAARGARFLANPLFTQEFQAASVGGKAATVAGVGMRMAGFFLAYQVLGEFLMGRGPEDGDRDEEEPESELLKWRNWTARKMLMAPISLVPIPGMATAVEAGLLKKRANTRGDPLGSFVQLVIDAMFDPTPEKAARIGALGTGGPIRSVDTTGTYIKDIATGERQLRGPFRTAAGLVYGERRGQPDNPLSVIADLMGE